MVSSRVPVWVIVTVTVMAMEKLQFSYSFSRAVPTDDRAEIRPIKGQCYRNQ